MAKAKRARESASPFYFPLCLTSATDSPETLGGLIRGYALVANGWDQIERKAEEMQKKWSAEEREEWRFAAFDAFNRLWPDADVLEGPFGEEIDTIAARFTGLRPAHAVFALGVIGRAGNQLSLGKEFDPRDWRHLAAAVGEAPPVNHAHRVRDYEGTGKAGKVYGKGLKPPPGLSWNYRGLVNLYERAVLWARAYEDAVGTQSSFLTMPRDFVADMVDNGQPDLREFRVIAAVYCGIGLKRKWGAVPLDRLQWMVDGFSSEKGFRLFDPEATRADVAPRTVAPAVSDVPLDGDGPARMNEKDGTYRYDRARSLYFRSGLHEGGVPFTGEGGAFTVHSTARGVAFVLAGDRDVLAGTKVGPTPELGRDFKTGDRVVWSTRQRGSGALLAGVVVGVDERQKQLTVQRHGAESPVSRSSNWVAPAALVPGADAALDVADVPMGASPPAERTLSLSKDQIRRLLDKLGPDGRKFFARGRDGRAGYFGRGIDQAELEEKLFEKADRKLTRDAAKKKREAVRRARVEARRAELAAEEAAAVASVSVPVPPRADSADTAPPARRDAAAIPPPNNGTPFPKYSDQRNPFHPYPQQRASALAEDAARALKASGSKERSTAETDRQPEASPLASADGLSTEPTAPADPGSVEMHSEGEGEPFVVPLDVPGAEPDPVPTPADATPPNLWRVTDEGMKGARSAEPALRSTPPPGSLTAREVFDWQAARGELDVWPPTGRGGAFRQVILTDRSARYVLRSSADVQAERKEAERERIEAAARGAGAAS